MNLNVSLPDELARFVEAKVESGRYASSSEVVRDALRLLEEQDHRQADEVRRLRQAWRDGMASGDFRPLDLEAVRVEGRRRAAAKLR